MRRDDPDVPLEHREAVLHTCAMEIQFAPPHLHERYEAVAAFWESVLADRPLNYNEVCTMPIRHSRFC